MTFVTVGSESIAELSASHQADMMRHELERIDRELPLGSVLEQRRHSMAESGTPYDTSFDRLMWNVIGSPYEMTGPRRWEQGADGLWRQYGYRLFSGLSDEGEILSVMGTTTGQNMRDGQGYLVHTLNLAKSEEHAWEVRGVDVSPPAGTLDFILHVGQVALKPESQPAEAAISFRVPSRSDASLKQGETRTYYRRLALKNLYSVVHAFDKKYGVLECLYASESAIADVLPLPTEATGDAPEPDHYVTAA